ncbi:hypothetical protein [Coleofasciculus sp. E1-EBD-02]|uniref:hypothetical protein n=1 Tax=Coleofasciculus sp. E1-EBD-02 TaxID=3068481 RepID=UPI0033020797
MSATIPTEDVNTQAAFGSEQNLSLSKDSDKQGEIPRLLSGGLAYPIKGLLGVFRNLMIN